jgi:hypothetical protein
MGNVPRRFDRGPAVRGWRGDFHKRRGPRGIAMNLNRLDGTSCLAHLKIGHIEQRTTKISCAVRR